MGVTAAESGTYNDFTNINLGGLDARRAATARTRCPTSSLEVLDELQLLQPQANVQLSAQDARPPPQGRLPRDPQGLGLPLALQRRRGRHGAGRAWARRSRTPARAAPQRLHRDRLLRQGGLPPPRLPQRAQDPRARPERRRRPPDGQADRPGDGRPASVRGLRGALRGLREAARLRRGPEGARVQLHRPHVRRARAGALPLGRHRRLHREGQGLLRRRRRATTPTTSSAAASARSPTASRPSRRTSSRTQTCALDRAAGGPAPRTGRARRPCACSLRQQDAPLRQRRRRADAHRARVYRHRSSGPSTAGPNTRAATYHLDMLSTTCHVYFGQDARARRPTAGGAAARYPTAPRPPRAPTATARRP